MTTKYCDFCSDSPVVARYSADDIIIFAAGDASLVQHSVGDWAACRVCETLIDSGHWDMLLDRAVESFYAKNPEAKEMPREYVAEYLADMYRVLRFDAKLKKAKF